jgi:hypothetical protein
MLNCKVLSDDFGNADPNYRGIAKVLMAMNLGMVTDMWGDCPFSEALQGVNNLTPHFDAQTNVLNSIQSLLDDAITDLANTNNNVVPGNDDFVYHGYVAAWTKVAWTLKARYYSRLSKKPGFDANVILTDLANGIASNADNCYAIHGNAGAETNQYASFLNNRYGYIVASQTLIDSLGGMTDPRTPYYFDTTYFGNVAVGNVLGDFNPGVSNWGPYLGCTNDGGVNPSQRIPMVTYAEAMFLMAEAKVRLSDPLADSILNLAIRASVQEVTAGAYDGSTVATYTPATTNLRTVITEKWKAMFANPVESYSAYRLTGFPALAINPAGLRTFIPKRLPTSEWERTSNPNAPTPDLGTPVWYAQ